MGTLGQIVSRLVDMGMSYIKGDEESLLATYSCYVELNPYFEDIFELL